MLKIFFSIFFFIGICFSSELKEQRFNLLAKEVLTKNDTIVANGDVVIISPNYYINADKIIYNRKNKDIELFDNVVIIKNKTLQTSSNYAFLNLSNDEYSQKPMILYDRNSDFWLSSKFAKKRQEILKLKNSILSTCDCIEPDWSIKVSSAQYNTETKWINVYNPRLYFKNIPVLYLPYLGFSTNKTRKTGLLTPTVGYSSSEGVFYSQPIYIAPAKNYDIEIIPQIREKRGQGVYAYLRYIDSLYSQLNIKFGGFFDKKKYQLNHELKNQKHYGWNLDYYRSKLFSSENSQDGLYASLNYLNDVEYITLEDYDNTSTSQKVESKINYFYNNSRYYGGLYARYYIDTSLESNDITLQELPQLQFHKYTEEIPYINRLIYSLDSKVYNYYRKKDLNSTIYELTLPLSYSKHIFNDYAYFKIDNEAVLSKYKYSNSRNLDYDDGLLIQNKLKLSIGSDLIKSYTSYFHTINLKGEYIIPKNVTEKGDLYNITTKNNLIKNKSLSSFPITQDDKKIKFSLNQSLHHKKSLKKFINHKMSQSILYNSLDEAKFQDFENHIQLNYKYGSMSNKLVYNMQDKTIIENDSSTTFKYKKFSLDLGYYKSKKTVNSNRDNLESYRINTSYQIAKDYKLSYYENYNLEDKIRNKQGISLDIADICWNLKVRYEKEINPTTTSSSKDNIEQRIIYMNLELKPIGGINQKYKIKDD